MNCKSGREISCSCYSLYFLTTKTTQVDYNKVTRVDNKKETNSAYQNQNTYKTFYKLYKTYSIDIANDNECIT